YTPHGTRRFSRLTVERAGKDSVHAMKQRIGDRSLHGFALSSSASASPLSSVAAPNHDSPSPRLTDILPTLAATGHRPTASRMVAASPDTRRQGGRTSAAMPTPHRTGGRDDESGGQMGKHMQVRRANDAELRRGFRFQRIVFVLLDAYCVDGSGDGDRVGEGAEPVEDPPGEMMELLLGFMVNTNEAHKHNST
ncbi:hypothetical protein V495_06790, partial [Pseudogymnoascus sp. VKM F-4514 (FW-929)]